MGSEFFANYYISKSKHREEVIKAFNINGLECCGLSVTLQIFQGVVAITWGISIRIWCLNCHILSEHGESKNVGFLVDIQYHFMYCIEITFCNDCTNEIGQKYCSDFCKITAGVGLTIDILKKLVLRIWTTGPTEITFFAIDLIILDTASIRIVNWCFVDANDPFFFEKMC